MLRTRHSIVHRTGSVVAAAGAVGALAAASFAPSARASGGVADVFIAGQPGEVWRADTASWSFAYYTCTCNGPVQGIVQAGDRLYVADTFGMLVTFTMQDANAFPTNFSFVEHPARAMVMDAGRLLIAGDDGVIRQVDPATGAVTGSRAAPIDIDAMIVAEGRLFIGGASGDIWSAPVSGGDFAYFTCACFPGVRSLAAYNGNILIGADNGILLSARIADGGFNFGTTLPTTLRAMAMHGNDLLAAGEDQQLHRIDPATGVILDSTPAPFVGDALVVALSNPADLNDDGLTNAQDLGMLLGAWGACSAPCAADLNGDSIVNAADLALLLGAWG